VTDVVLVQRQAASASVGSSRTGSRSRQRAWTLSALFATPILLYHPLNRRRPAAKHAPNLDHPHPLHTQRPYPLLNCRPYLRTPNHLPLRSRTRQTRKHALPQHRTLEFSKHRRHPR
jgi:hypothetical protein